MKIPQASTVPFITCHIAVYACNRVTCFHGDTDYSRYLDSLITSSKLHGVAVHAYVLLCNHVHLIATPADKFAVHCLVQDLNSLHEEYLQQEYRHKGRLWQENYHLSMVQEGRYLVDCYRYIEMNPVRIGLADRPADHRWSSYHYHADGKTDPAITVHNSYIALGNSDRERQETWRSFLGENPGTYETYKLKRALFYSRPVGDEKFIAEMGRTIEQDRRSAAATGSTPAAECMQ